MIKKVLLILSIFVFAQNLNANEQINLVKKQLLQTIDNVVVIVKDKNISKEIRNNKIINAITPIFNFKLMAKLSLGKVWKQLKKSDQELFIKLYVQRMKQSYSSKLDSYSDEKVKIVNIKQTKRNRIVITTNLTNEDNNLEILYKFYKLKRAKKDKDNWLIYDVEILGVSILKTDKAQFKEFLQTKNISELMNVLAKQ